MKTNELRPQEIKSQTIQRSTLILSVALAIFVTLVFTTIANWFIYTNIHNEARQNVVSDMRLTQQTEQVSKIQK